MGEENLLRIICLTWKWHTQAPGSAPMAAMELVLNTERALGSDQHLLICPNLGTLGEPDWQKLLDTKPEPHAGVPQAPLDLVTVFQRELSAAVASRVCSVQAGSVTVPQLFPWQRQCCNTWCLCSLIHTAEPSSTSLRPAPPCLSPGSPL